MHGPTLEASKEAEEEAEADTQTLNRTSTPNQKGARRGLAHSRSRRP
jgi:hypothetical protein